MSPDGGSNVFAMFPLIGKDRGNHPRLSKDYRGLFPFRLATTSYIYPDHILPNALLLAPYLNEMELILFESQNPPTGEEVTALGSLQKESGFSYNVHLPLDIALGHSLETKRAEGVEAVKEIVTLTRVLNPTSYTLHYDGDHARCPERLASWQRHISQSTEAILEMGLDPASISVETLDYPFVWVEDVIENHGLSICLDLGHLVLTGEDPRHYLDRYLERTTVVHLHGVYQGHGHRGLDALSESVLTGWLSRLQGYTGTVSIEVFSFDHLQRSLVALEKAWGKV